MTGIVVTADLIERARDGDEQAFRELVGSYQRELQVHCYRILGPETSRQGRPTVLQLVGTVADRSACNLSRRHGK